jgi:uncharacterized cupin superfamily protein
MQKISVDAADNTSIEGCERLSLSDALGATAVSLNEYRVAPGEGLPAGVHAHMDQEELFVVLDGVMTFETMDGNVTVSEFEAIRFAPGEFQSGRNDSDDELVVLAIGAPSGTEDIRIPVECPDCEYQTLRLEPGGEELTFVCPGCDATHVPSDCPNCEEAALQITLDDEGRAIVVCQDCGRKFESPPLED